MGQDNKMLRKMLGKYYWLFYSKLLNKFPLLKNDFHKLYYTGEIHSG